MNEDDRKNVGHLMALAKVLDHPEIVAWNRLVARPWVDPREKRKRRRRK